MISIQDTPPASITTPLTLPSKSYRFVGPKDDEDAASSPTSPGEKPKPLLNTFQLAGLAFLLAIGGPYGLEECVKAAGPMYTIIFTAFLPFLWCLPTTLCTAELACSIPSNGGAVMWINVAYPTWITFTTVLWTLMISFVDNALYPSLAADYLNSVMGLSPNMQTITKCAVVIMCALTNILGLEIVGIGSTILIILVLAPFVVLGIMFFTGSSVFDAGSLRWDNIGHVPPSIHWAAFLPVVSWNLAGLENCGNLAEEIRNPQKTYPRALVIVIFMTILTYIPPVMIGVSAYDEPTWHRWKDGYWTNIAHHVGGHGLQVFMLVGSLCSAIGFLLTNMCTTSRQLAGMAQIGIFPGWVGRRLGKYHVSLRTPVNAIVVNAIILLIFSLALEFEQLVAIDQIVYCFRLILLYGALVILRYKYPTLPRPFRLPGGTLGMLLMLGLAACFNVALGVLSIIGDLQIFIFCVITLVGSAVAGVVVTRVRNTTLQFQGSIE
eukprot:PhF_6_TR21686/c0_g1_i1/m.30958